MASKDSNGSTMSCIGIHGHFFYQIASFCRIINVHITLHPTYDIPWSILLLSKPVSPRWYRHPNVLETNPVRPGAALAHLLRATLPLLEKARSHVKSHTSYLSRLGRSRWAQASLNRCGCGVIVPIITLLRIRLIMISYQITHYNGNKWGVDIVSSESPINETWRWSNTLVQGWAGPGHPCIPWAWQILIEPAQTRGVGVHCTSCMLPPRSCQFMFPPF